MTATSAEQFCEWYNEAAQLYDDDKLLECIQMTRKILADATCHSYLRIKALVLLGDSLGNWQQGNEC